MVVESGGWSASLLEVGSLPMQPEVMGPPDLFSGPVEIPVNVLVLRGRGSTVLVDAGPGPLAVFWPGATAERPAVAPDLVVLTHLDFDHLGGLVTESMEPLFPDARLVMAEGAGRIVPDLERRRASRRALEALEVEEIGDGEVAPGLRLRPAPGHRSGHSVVEVGDEVLFLADVVHHPSHVEHPEWDTKTDDDPEVALRTRLAILAETAERRLLVAASHLRGFARVERSGGGLRWLPDSRDAGSR
jgi:glyoxylase-like metal-dependent hydrolase (beta-lactamase superfamily II)